MRFCSLCFPDVSPPMDKFQNNLVTQKIPTKPVIEKCGGKMGVRTTCFLKGSSFSVNGFEVLTNSRVFHKDSRSI